MGTTIIGGQPPQNPQEGDRWASSDTDMLWEFRDDEWHIVDWDSDLSPVKSYDRAMRGI